MRFLAVLVFFALAGATARAAEPVASIPYRIDYNGWFAVSVFINGQGPYDFIIDSGATQTLVYENLALQQDFPPSGGPDQRVLSLASQGTFPTYIVGEVALGAAKLDRLVTVVLADWSLGQRLPQGVLGLDFLAKYDVVFEAPTQTLHIYPAGEAPDSLPGRWHGVNLDRDDFGLSAGYLFTVDSKIGSTKVTLLLDLGASGTVINRPALHSVMARNFRIYRNVTNPRITDALSDTEKVTALRVVRFQVGRASWRSRLILIHDAPIFTELGRADKPFGLFGADLLHDRSFALKFAEQRFLIGPIVKRANRRGT